MFGEDVYGGARAVVGAVDLSFGSVFGDRAFDDARADAFAALRQGIFKESASDTSQQVDGGLSEDAGGQIPARRQTC